MEAVAFDVPNIVEHIWLLRRRKMIVIMRSADGLGGEKYAIHQV